MPLPQVKASQHDGNYNKSYKTEPQPDLKDLPFLGFVHLFPRFLWGKFTHSHLISAEERKAKGGGMLSIWLYLEDLRWEVRVLMPDPNLPTGWHFSDSPAPRWPLSPQLHRHPYFYSLGGHPLFQNSEHQRFQIVLFALSWPRSPFTKYSIGVPSKKWQRGEVDFIYEWSTLIVTSYVMLGFKGCRDGEQCIVQSTLEKPLGRLRSGLIISQWA